MDQHSPSNPDSPDRPESNPPAESAGTSAKPDPPTEHDGIIGEPKPAGAYTLEGWMAEHPWHPRVAPFLVYICFLPIVGQMRDWQPQTYILGYTLQCTLVAWLLWRFRRYTPELNLRFDWRAVPVGVGVFVAWVWLGHWIVEDVTLPESLAPAEPTDFIEEMGPAVGWAALSLRLIGMSLLVPLFEELFIRSLLLRSFHRFRSSMHGLAQAVMDLPLLGDWLYQTDWGGRIGHDGPVFGPEFKRTPLGALSLWGIAVSTLVFTIHHTPRDWLGCVVCALAYCFLLSATRAKGLGPVCWAHGITNALLWGYTVYTRDWQFL